MGFKNGKAGAALRVKVTTKASVAGITGIMGDGTVKIRLTSAPVDGKANEELLAMLAKIFNVHKDKVEIIAGHTGKNKIIAIYGIDSDITNEILKSHMR